MRPATAAFVFVAAMLGLLVLAPSDARSSWADSLSRWLVLSPAADELTRASALEHAPDIVWPCRSTDPSLAVRSEPASDAPVVAWLAADEAFDATARTAEASWLRGAAGTAVGWAPRGLLDCPDDLPVWQVEAGSPYPPPPPNSPPAEPPWGEGGFVAFNVARGTVGNQPHEGPLGMDFQVLEPIAITHIGVFDSGQNGLRRPIEAALWDRSNAALGEPATRLVTLHFEGDDGDLVGGSRFLALDEPLELPAGFWGTIWAEGYGVGEPNGNGIGGPVAWTMDDGDGLIVFAGSRWDWPFQAGGFPSLVDGPPVNRYAAGTFRFVASGP